MEIVIENPVESSSPPPPPPPPPPQISTSTWNAIVSAPPTSKTSTVVTCTSTPAVMTITIAENPTAPTYPPPVHFSYRESYAGNSIPFTGDFYSTRRPQPHTRSYDDPDGASPSVRRVDKSGLLGITEPETPSLRAASRSPRYLSAINGTASGILSPRRFECIGQLDPVPEVPGQISRGNVTPGSPKAFPVSSASSNLAVDAATSMLGQERGDGSSLDSRGRHMQLASFDPLESRYRNDHVYERRLSGIESSNFEATDYGSSFRFQESCEARGRCLGRLSQFALTRNERNNALESVARYTETCCNFPFVARTPTAFPGFEGTPGLPSSRAATTTATTSTATVATSTMREIETSQKDEEKVADCMPDEERAEAEGCEHGSTSNPLKDGESSERADEMADNDGIQTLRVIILSEQL